MKKHFRAIIIMLLFALTFTTLSSCTGNGDVSTAESTDTSDAESGSLKHVIANQLSGTFIQPWLYSSWNDARWDAEIAIWKELGIEYVIMGDTASYNLDTGKLTTSYPTSIEGATYSSDVTTVLYKKCKEHGLKIFIGMGNTANGWPFFSLEDDDNREVFKNVCKVFASVAEDIYNCYYEDYNDVFAGFYFVPEMYNSSMFDNETTRTKYVSGMTYGLEEVFTMLNSLNPDLPFIFSPYVNIFGESWVSKSSENIGLFWKNFLAAASFRNGDILCPQDSVGADGMDLDHLEEYCAMYKKAVTECGKDIKFWSNCETFVQPSGDFFSLSDDVSYWGSCSVGRLVKQFETAGKYAEKIVTFAFPHYQSPYNNVAGYYDTYVNYLKTGVLESEAPTGPNKFRTLKQTLTINGESTTVLRIYWSGMYDNFGIWKVNIYKNGKLLTYRYTTRAESGIASYPNSFYDADYDFDNENATYEFEVIDCAGNVGERISFTVEADSVPNNVKLDKAYTGPS